MFADTFRGPDSTGVCLIDKDNNSYVYKRALAGYDFVGSPAFEKMMYRTDPVVAIGHNRAATRGSVQNHTAHPFQWGKIILAHNGTLNNHRALQDGSKFQVDSEYIAYAFNKFGVLDTLKKIRGAFALTWYDLDTKLFNVVRNDERALHYGYNTEKDTMMYATEGELMNWISSRNDLDLDDNSFYEFAVNKWYTIDPETLDMNSTDVEFAPKCNVYRHPNYGTRNNYVPSGKEVKFQKSLSDLGLEKDEKIFVRWARTSLNGVPLFTLGEWYPVESKFDITIKDHTILMDYVRKNGDEIFSATVVGCKHTEGTSSYTVYIKDLKTDEDDKEKKDAAGGEFLPLPGPGNSAVSLQEWTRLIEDGCCNCTSPIHREDADYIQWTRTKKPVCSDCCMLHHVDSSASGLEGLLE